MSNFEEVFDNAYDDAVLKNFRESVKSGNMLMIKNAMKQKEELKNCFGELEKGNIEDQLIVKYIESTIKEKCDMQKIPLIRFITPDKYLIFKKALNKVYELQKNRIELRNEIKKKEMEIRFLDETTRLLKK